MLYVYYTKNSWYYHKFDFTLKTVVPRRKHVTLLCLMQWLFFVFLTDWSS